MRHVLPALAVLMITGGSASAAVVLEFNDVPDFGGGCTAPEPFVIESGFTIGNCPQFNTRPGTIHLDDFGTAYNAAVQFSGPRPFDAISVEIDRLGWEFTEFVDPDRIDRPYDNLVFRGFRDGSEVVNQTASTFESGGTFLFDATFSALDLLEIEQVLPGSAVLAQFPNAECDAPCAHVDLERVTLAPVPLPATFLPLALGITALAGFRGWRSSARA